MNPCRFHGVIAWKFVLQTPSTESLPTEQACGDSGEEKLLVLG